MRALLPRGLRHASPAFLIALALASLDACRTPTAVRLLIHTDVACGDVGGTAITVGTNADIENAPSTTSTTQCNPDGTIGTLVIVPTHSKDGPVSVHVVMGVGQPPDSCLAPSYGPQCIVARRQLDFVPHEDLDLPVDMLVDCKGIACDATTTCNKGACTPALISKCVNGDCDLPDVGSGGGDASGGASNGGAGGVKTMGGGGVKNGGAGGAPNGGNGGAIAMMNGGAPGGGAGTMSGGSTGGGGGPTGGGPTGGGPTGGAPSAGSGGAITVTGGGGGETTTGGSGGSETTTGGGPGVGGASMAGGETGTAGASAGATSAGSAGKGKGGAEMAGGAAEGGATAAGGSLSGGESAASPCGPMERTTISDSGQYACLNPVFQDTFELFVCDTVWRLVGQCPLSCDPNSPAACATQAPMNSPCLSSSGPPFQRMSTDGLHACTHLDGDTTNEQSFTCNTTSGKWGPSTPVTCLGYVCDVVNGGCLNVPACGVPTGAYSPVMSTDGKAYCDQPPAATPPNLGQCVGTTWQTTPCPSGTCNPNTLACD